VAEKSGFLEKISSAGDFVFVAFGLDFVATGLVFVAPGFDFLAPNLDFGSDKSADRRT
jgi:hypothetical protein